MIPPFDYKIPRTLKEACDLLWDFGDKARLIAGGTDLVIALRKGDVKPSCLIDVTNIPELRMIEEQNGMVSIGAAVTHSEIASSSIIKKYGKVLSDASSAVGCPQIRNVGTIGGNIVNASPAADTVAALMVLDAAGKVVAKSGERETPLRDLFSGPYQTSLQNYEILAGVSFPKLSPSMKCSFVRLARREAMAVNWMSIAIILRMERNMGRIEDVRISLGAMTSTPNRMWDAEAFLRGKRPDEKLLQITSEKVSEAMVSSSGIRPETPYKSVVVKHLFVRAFKQALEKDA
jgi:CO/xanthine dehydrogenase FAD-binding subunit